MSLLAPSPIDNYEANSFDPLSIPDCQIWFDAADTSTITTSGSQVTSWRNKGSISMNATNNTGSCTSGNTTATGLNYINCPAGADLAFTCALNTQARTWFVVMRNKTQLTTSTFAPLIATTVLSQNAILFTQQSGDNYNLTLGLQTGTSTNTARVTSVTMHNPFNIIGVYCVVNSDTGAGENIITSNGYDQTTLSTSSLATGYVTTSGQYLINRASYSTANDYFEILFYPRVLTANERRQLEGYLSWKWGTASSFLPTDIPDCKFWLDGSDYSTFTFATEPNVASWTDKVSNISLNQLAATGLYPTRTNINYAYGVNFGNSTTSSTWTNNATYGLFFKNTVTPAFTLSSRSITVVVVASTTINTGTFRYALRMYSTSPSTTANPGMLISIQPYSPSGSSYRVDNSSNFSASVGSASGLSASILIAKNAGTNTDNQLVVNGNNLAVTYSNSTYNSTRTYPVNYIALGSSNSLTDYGNGVFSGTVSEVLIYDRAITDAERVTLSTYLNRKYVGSATLPDSIQYYHPYQISPTTSRIFRPTDIDACKLWLDASDSSTFTLSGSSMIQWRDKSGNSDSTTSGGTFNTTGNLGNSLSTLTITNTYVYTNNLIGISGSSPQTYVVVANTSDATIYFSMLHWLAAGGGDAYTGSSTIYIRRDAVYTDIYPSGSTVSITGLTQAKTKMAIVTHTGSIASLYESGTSAASTSSNVLNQLNGALRIGISGAGASVEIGEIMVFNRALTDAERKQIEGYLGWKWGIAGNLPSTQPFYYSPSVISRPPSSPMFRHEAITLPGYKFDLASGRIMRHWIDASCPNTYFLYTSGSAIQYWFGRYRERQLSQTTTGMTLTQNIESGSMPAVLYGTGGYSFGNLSFGVTSYNATPGICSLFVVYRINTGATAGGRIISLGAATTLDTGNDSYFSLSYNASAGFRVIRNASTVDVGSSPGLDTFHLATVIYDGTTGSYFLDGGSATGTAAFTTNLNISRITIGRNQTAVNLINNLYIAEVIFLSGTAAALTTTQRQIIEGYLGWKWRSLLPNFPTSHPYKYVKP